MEKLIRLHSEASINGKHGSLQMGCSGSIACLCTLPISVSHLNESFNTRLLPLLPSTVQLTTPRLSQEKLRRHSVGQKYLVVISAGRTKMAAVGEHLPLDRSQSHAMLSYSNTVVSSHEPVVCTTNHHQLYFQLTDSK